MLWHIELKFYIWLCFAVLQIKSEYRQFASIFVGVMHLWELYTENTVFRTFLLHALTYWAEILHMILFYCTTDQVQVSSIRITFCRSNAPFGILEIHSLPHFSLHALTYWAEIFHMTLFYCTTDQVRVSSIRINFCRSNAPFGTHFSLTCFVILSWNFTYDFVLLYCISRSSVVNSHQFLWELCPFWNLILKIQFSHFPPTCFDILTWSFSYDFVLLYYRSTLSVIHLCPYGSESVHPFSACSSYMYMHWQI